jgi:hypothetical protein
MGIRDEVDRAKAAKAREEELNAAWAQSDFEKSSPRLGPPPPAWEGFVRESLGLLRFDVDVVVGTAPDGSTRIDPPTPRLVIEPKLFGGKRTRSVTPKATHKAACVLVGPQGKDSPNCIVWVLRDGRIALRGDLSFFEREGTAETVRAAFVAKLASY